MNTRVVQTQKSNPRKALSLLGNTETAEPKALSAFWHQELEEIKNSLRNTKSGISAAIAYSELVDTILEDIFEKTKVDHEERYGIFPHPVTLLSIGSYGRKLLPCGSTAGIVLLYPQRIRPEILRQFENIFKNKLSKFADLFELKFNYACRSIAEAIDLSKNDFKIKNNQFESRIIVGSGKLFKLFLQTYENYTNIEPKRRFLSACINEQKERWKLFDYTVLLKEPNIEKGPGGLQDYESLLHVARGQHDDEYSLFSQDQKEQLQKAYDFLLRVHTEMHFANKQGIEHLDIGTQKTIAPHLGYHDSTELSASESMMKDFFKATVLIHELSKAAPKKLLQQNKPFLESLSLRLWKKAQPQSIIKRYDGFTLVDKTITAQSTELFLKNPIKLVKAFRYCQIHQASPSDKLVQLISNALSLARPDTFKNPASLSVLYSIISNTGDVFTPLSKMYQSGLLERLIPEFENLRGLVLDDPRVYYTADIHVLGTLKTLDSIYADKDGSKSVYSNALRSSTQPHLLQWMLLLQFIDRKQQDLTKTLRILKQLSVKPFQAERILNVIKNSQLLLDYATKPDALKESNLLEFLTKLDNKDELRYLFVFTYCNSVINNKGTWDPNTENAHVSFYKCCIKYLRDNPDLYNAKYKELQNEYLLILKNNLPQDENEAFHLAANQYNNRYLLNYGPTEKIAHIKLIEALKKRLLRTHCSGTLIPEVLWDERKDSCLIVATLATWDRPGLLYQLAGAFSSLGLNIRTTKINTRADRLVLDTFYLENTNLQKRRKSALHKAFNKKMEEILINDLDPQKAVSSAFKNYQGQIIKHSDVKINTSFNATKNHIIVDIQTKDRIGLLHDISRVFNKLGFNVTFAKIRTHRGISIDTFFIEKNNGDEITTVADLIQLRTCIIQAITTN